MIKRSYLDNHFLIAMPALQDPNFARAVVVLCQHNDEGALGIVVNRVSGMQLGELLHQLDIGVSEPALGEQAVYLGGPVQQDRGFVLHEPHGDFDSSFAVSDQLHLTTSRDVLEALASGQGPQRALVALGYAGWSAGQLEQELLDNAWLSTPLDPDLLFDLPPDERWQAAAASIGIDPVMLSSYAGHA
ncbi:MAG: YqgE/AlgH family protein [Xanthomonadales bacterium]|nr:YqgE/AlgH family protein [Xanthomonadales bacterium]MCB1627172.1 YqgE/AlgH family protein [Xanthomonadales bacterium]MCB1633122.1 YqgE/AlgH family protein [Xanthomonadales bacterium]MCB1640763.1 YqgE/AlgH family protein [Xanthomonadales bacterium]